MCTTTIDRVISLPNTAENALRLQDHTEQLIRNRVSTMFSGSKARDIMLFLQRQAELCGLEQSECAKSALAQLNDFSFNHRLSISGSIGEKKALEASKAIKGDRIIIANLELDMNGCHNEYDLIVIRENALFSIEVKNYSKDVVLDEYGVIRFCDGKGPLCYNAGERSRAKEYALYSYLNNAGIAVDRNSIHSVILFANDRGRFYDNFHMVKLCSRGTICDYVESFQSCGETFSQCQMEAIEECLVNGHSPLDLDESRFDELLASVSRLVDLVTPKESAEDSVEAVDNQSAYHCNDIPNVNTKAAIGLGVGFVAGTIVALAAKHIKAGIR